MVEMVRLRIAFERHRILSKSQKKQGLKKCWVLFKPKRYKTISHLSDYLLRVFRLHHSSPHGLTLSMDGFVLPPFESTCIFKDNDIVCARKKAASPAEAINLDNGVNALDQPDLAGVKLLANEEFEGEIGDNGSESEEDEPKKSLDELYLDSGPDVGTVCKKRKASKKLGGSKSKKTKLATEEESPVGLEDVEKNLASKDKSTEWQGEIENSSTPEIDETSKSFPDAKRFRQLKENGSGTGDVSSSPGGSKKDRTSGRMIGSAVEKNRLYFLSGMFPSRSARRKKAKRCWLREQAKKEKIEKQLLAEGNQQSPDKDDQKVSDRHQQPDTESCDQHNEKLFEECQQADPNSDADDDVVPIVIRPGHIRFAPLRKVDAVQATEQNEIPVETFRCKGVTSKKGGQKWVKKKVASTKRNNYENFNQEYFKMLTMEEEIAIHEPKELDFDKLKPYTSSPKEGDVIAFRLIELSSSWTPELTSYRVGKISQYNVESNRIMLLPIPEYPIAFEKKMDEDASALKSDTSSLYEEDGSLQIDFSLLLDVRIVMHDNSNDSKSITDGLNDIDAVTNLRDNHERASAPAQGWFKAMYYGFQGKVL